MIQIMKADFMDIIIQSRFIAIYERGKEDID
jgi:hypothetical protein